GERVSAANSHGLAVSRARLLDTLHALAVAAGVEVRLDVDADAGDFSGSDVVVVAEGVGSCTRDSHAEAFGACVVRGAAGADRGKAGRRGSQAGTPYRSR